MIYDEKHPHLQVVYLIILEAVQHRSNQVQLLRTTEDITVTFRSGESEFVRDQMPGRFWHSLLSILHFMLSETVNQILWDSATATSVDTTEIHPNTILITDAFPNYEITFLKDLKAEADLPVYLDVTFSEKSVIIRIRQTNQT